VQIGVIRVGNTRRILERFYNSA